MNKNISQKLKLAGFLFLLFLCLILIIIFSIEGFPGIDFLGQKQSQAAPAEEIIPLQAARGPLLYDFHQLMAAGTLMSLASGVLDYNTLLAIRHYQEIEITTFPGWEDIDLKVNSQIIKDPVTFYFPKLGNEEAIGFAETLLWAGESGEPPPEDWIPPDPMPGALQYPLNLATPGVSYSSHFWACRETEINPCGRYHAGIDLAARKFTPVFAAADGIVMSVNKTDSHGGGYGYWIIVYHDKLNLSTHYTHLENVGGVPGQRVKAGETIAGVGNTGATTYHLHFEVYPCQIDAVGWKDKKGGAGFLNGKVNCWAVDPIGYLPPIQKEKCSLGWKYYPDFRKTPPPACASCVSPDKQCQ